MDSLITFFCIIILCIFVYGYIMMRHKYNDYSQSCNVLYIPRNNSSDIKDRLPHMEVLDHEVDDIKFFDQSVPRGISELENIIPSLNQRYDSIELREIGG